MMAAAAASLVRSKRVEEWKIKVETCMWEIISLPHSPTLSFLQHQETSDWDQIAWSGNQLHHHITTKTSTTNQSDVCGGTWIRQQVNLLLVSFDLTVSLHFPIKDHKRKWTRGESALAHRHTEYRELKISDGGKCHATDILGCQPLEMEEVRRNPTFFHVGEERM